MDVTPSVAVIPAWILLGEVLGMWQAIGTVTTVAEISLTRLASKALI